MQTVLLGAPCLGDLHPAGVTARGVLSMQVKAHSSPRPSTVSSAMTQARARRNTVLTALRAQALSESSARSADVMAASLFFLLCRVFTNDNELFAPLRKGYQ